MWFAIIVGLICYIVGYGKGYQRAMARLMNRR